MSASSGQGSGAIAWMAQNSVAANLLMAVLVVGGVLIGRGVTQEVFPEFELDMIQVAVPYPGASPAEVEQGIVLAAEEAIRGIDGIEQVSSSAREGMASLSIELVLGADRDKVVADTKAAIDRITSFPADVERPVVTLVTNRRTVISVVVYGDISEHTRRQLAEQIRDDLLADPNITQVEISGIRAPEVSVEVPQATLRAYGLTLRRIAEVIRNNAVEVPGGGIKTAGGEVLVRTAERRDRGTDFADIAVISRPDGTTVRLGDIATIRDGFAQTDKSASFNGKPAARVNVYRVGEQTPVEVAAAVKRYVQERQGQLPKGVQLAVWRDRSEIYNQRIDLLLRNARLGLVLVLLILGLFLELRLAFWVTMGIPISFFGSLLLMPAMDVTINMISLFAFIVTLGMVVDDAIIVGENVYEKRRGGMARLPAAIEGAREMAKPVTFAILTTIAAFSPMFFVPGFMGKIFRVIPAVVVSVLLISLLESLFVLPAHLAHSRSGGGWRVTRWLMGHQQRFSGGFERFVERRYRPLLGWVLRWRYLVVAVGLACLILTLGYIGGGRMAFTFMPQIESDRVLATATLPYGAPVEATRKVQERLLSAANAVLEEHGGDGVCRGIYATLAGSIGRGGPGVRMSSSGSHITAVRVLLVPSAQRELKTSQFVRAWRERVGEVPGLESLTFRFSHGPSAGEPINVELNHPDMKILERAATDLAVRLRSFAGVREIDDGFSDGKRQLNLRIRPEGHSLGIQARDLARQLRGSFFGVEALRQQRGRDEVRVMVRLPEAERRSEHDIESLVLRTAQGGEIPLKQAAAIDRGRAYTAIRRQDGRRAVNVTADVDRSVTTPDKVFRALQDKALPVLLADYPGLRYQFAGERRERNKSLKHLGRGYILALILIFALLAVPFRSYVQPLVVMAAIPFGIIGAVLGHLVMGFDLSIISLMGIVALSGVVVNDSLVLIDASNRKRDQGFGHLAAIAWAGERRFRPILLTSLTTFFGLAPMIFETSMQARFLIPMAISLGFGILFATFIVLLLVPSLYLVVEDIRNLYTSEQPASGEERTVVIQPQSGDRH